MRRTNLLGLGLLTVALMPVLAQAETPTGKIHGHVTNPTGAPQTTGTVTLTIITRAASGPGLSPQTEARGTLKLSSNGDYSGETEPGDYVIVFRTEGMSQDKVADKLENIHVKPGQDVEADIDMSRKEYIDAMSPEDKRHLEEVRTKNAAVMKANEVIKNLNADINQAIRDFKDADSAHATAVTDLGASASRSDVDAKETEIKTAKYTEVETMMLKDTAARPGESVLWTDLGQAQLGLKKFDDAETAYKKAIELEAAKKTPNPSSQGAAQAGLGEIYARTGKVPEANAAYDAAAKANPAGAGGYLKNEAVIFSQVGNADAQVAAADEAIKADPTQALPYYLKGQGLIGKATIDTKTGKMVLPPGCAEAYQKYLDLAAPPNDRYAADVKAILAEATQTHSSAYGDQNPPKKKKGGN